MNIPSETIKYGRNADNIPLADDKYIRCWKCGFINHISRNAKASIGSRAGDGISRDDGDNAWGDAKWGNKRWGESTAQDFTISAGCSFCGCLHYDRRN